VQLSHHHTIHMRIELPKHIFNVRIIYRHRYSINSLIDDYLSLLGAFPRNRMKPYQCLHLWNNQLSIKILFFMRLLISLDFQLWFSLLYSYWWYWIAWNNCDCDGDKQPTPTKTNFYNFYISLPFSCFICCWKKKVMELRVELMKEKKLCTFRV
jgi:hypothetical protein